MGNDAIAWVTTTEAAKKLGFSADHLRQLRIDGLFDRGFHYRAISGKKARRQTYRWHVARCEATLEVPEEYR
jgi:hypothetical protein